MKKPSLCGVNDTFVCSFCGKSYTYRSGLSKHSKNEHNDVESGCVTCSPCNNRYTTLTYNCIILIIASFTTGLQKLTTHLHSHHQLSVEEEELWFDTLFAFTVYIYCLLLLSSELSIYIYFVIEYCYVKNEYMSLV